MRERGAPASLAPTPTSFTADPPKVHETHLSVLTLIGDRAYKLKKPIELPFVDLRTREARLRILQREVALNRRLAPDVYLGVLDVVGEDGTPCDHVMVMRRMPEERRLSVLVRQDGDLDASVRGLAGLLVSFHARERLAPESAEPAGRDAVARNWADNLDALRSLGGTTLDTEALDRVEELSRRYLAGRRPLWEDRARAGMVVDGHGDLLADDIYLMDDGPQVLDCLEFSDDLRVVDALDDVAFLAMDLERLGAGEHARALVDAYMTGSGERHPVSLLHHFVAYRAGVRAKVAAVRAAQGSETAADDARLLLELARTHLEAGRVRLVLVGGLPGTGKSTVAAALGERLGWTVLRSDVVRKEMAGMAPADHGVDGFGKGLYDQARTRETYLALLGRARELLVRGESVVLDATWPEASLRRAAAELAADTSTDVVALQCTLPPDVAARRIRERSRTDPSDATPEVAAAMADRWEPWPDAAVLDTAAPLEVTLDDALRRLGASCWSARSKSNEGTSEP